MTAISMTRCGADAWCQLLVVQPICRLNCSGLNGNAQAEQASAETTGFKPHVNSWAPPAVERFRHAIDTDTRETSQIIPY
jgi:hypothetical protein